jgi:hypothetical protein
VIASEIVLGVWTLVVTEIFIGLASVFNVPEKGVETTIVQVVTVILKGLNRLSVFQKIKITIIETIAAVQSIDGIVREQETIVDVVQRIIEDDTGGGETRVLAHISYTLAISRREGFALGKNLLCRNLGLKIDLLTWGDLNGAIVTRQELEMILPTLLSLTGSLGKGN